MENERRTAPRAAVEVTVKLIHSGGTQSLRATGISHRGLFVRTDTPCPLRRIVRLCFDTPDHPGLQILALVVHTISPDEAVERGLAPGMGLQLYGLGPVAGRAWRQWVDQLFGVSSSFSSPTSVDAINRFHRRYLVQWPARIETEGGLKFTTRDLSLGGAFLVPARALPKGIPLTLTLRHHRGPSTQRLSVRVVRQNSEGVAVTFEPLSAASLDALEAFIHEGLNDHFEDELILLETDDRALA